MYNPQKLTELWISITYICWFHEWEYLWPDPLLWVINYKGFSAHITKIYHQNCSRTQKKDSKRDTRERQERNIVLLWRMSRDVRAPPQQVLPCTILWRNSVKYVANRNILYVINLQNKYPIFLFYFLFLTWKSIPPLTHAYLIIHLSRILYT